MIVISRFHLWVFFFRDFSKVSISPRGASSVWPLQNIQLCKSAVKNLRYQTQIHSFQRNAKNINTQITRVNISFYISCRLQLRSLKFNRSEPPEERFRKFCLHRHWQHPGTRWSAARERREGEQDHSSSFCNLSPCSWTPLHPCQGSTVIHGIWADCNSIRHTTGNNWNISIAVTCMIKNSSLYIIFVYWWVWSAALYNDHKCYNKATLKSISFFFIFFPCSLFSPFLFILYICIYFLPLCAITFYKQA